MNESDGFQDQLDVLYQFSSAFSASNQQSTAQATQSEKATNLSTITGG